MTQTEKIIEALKGGNYTAKQLQQMTGTNNIFVILNYLGKKNKIKKEKMPKTIQSNGPKTVFVYSLITETASQDA
jgi:hypothetical protein